MKVRGVSEFLDFFFQMHCLAYQYQYGPKSYNWLSAVPGKGQHASWYQYKPKLYHLLLVFLVFLLLTRYILAKTHNEARTKARFLSGGSDAEIGKTYRTLRVTILRVVPFRKQSLLRNDSFQKGRLSKAAIFWNQRLSGKATLQEWRLLRSKAHIHSCMVSKPSTTNSSVWKSSTLNPTVDDLNKSAWIRDVTHDLVQVTFNFLA